LWEPLQPNKGNQEAKAKAKHVGPHLPLKGEGNDHPCVMCDKEYTEPKENGETLKRKKTSFKREQCNVYLCIGLPA